MDTPAGGRGRRADEEAGHRRNVWAEANDRAGEVLVEILDAAIDVAADVVGVVGLHLDRRQRVARQDALAETRRKALDLRLDARRHVHVRATGHVTVGPDRLLAVRS